MMRLPRTVVELAARFRTRAIATRDEQRQHISIGLALNCERLVDQRKQLTCRIDRAGLAGQTKGNPAALSESR